jgi:hypothetical protein
MAGAGGEKNAAWYLVESRIKEKCNCPAVNAVRSNLVQPAAAWLLTRAPILS